MAATPSIAQIINEGTTVRMVYQRQDGDISERIVTVDRVWECTRGMAFVGMCHLRGERRTFNEAHVLFAEVWDGTPITTFASDRPPGILDTDYAWTVIDSLNLPAAQQPWDDHSAKHMVAEMGPAASLRALLDYSRMGHRWSDENWTA